MLAAIEIPDAVVTVPTTAGAILAFSYAVWPATVAKRCSLIAGFAMFSLTLAIGTFNAGAVDPSPAPGPRPIPAPLVTPAGNKLAELVPVEQRAKIGAFYRDLAAVAVSEDVTTSEQLRKGYRKAGSIYKQVGKLPSGLAEFAAATDAMLTDALGKESRPITQADREKFANVCLRIAAEMGVQP